MAPTIKNIRITNKTISKCLQDNRIGHIHYSLTLPLYWNRNDQFINHFVLTVILGSLVFAFLMTGTDFLLLNGILLLSLSLLLLG